MKKVFLLVRREFKLFKGNKLMKTLYFGGPILFGLLFGAIYLKGKMTDLPIIVVDKDQSPLSAKLIDMLDDNDMLLVKYVLQENVDVQDKFINEGIQAAVVIPDYFEADIRLGKYPEVNTYINNGNLVTAGYANRSINLVVATLNAIASAKTGRPATAIQLNIFRLFNPSSNYLTFIWPSFLAVILQSVILIVTAMSFVSERGINNFRELAELKMNPLSILTGKLFIYWSFAPLVALIYAFYFFIFKQSLPVHIADTLFIGALFVVSVSLQGMIAGLLFDSHLKIIQSLMILIMPAYISSAFSWPFEYYGLPAQIYGVLFPLLPLENGFRILLIEHGTLADISDFILLQVIQLSLYFLIALLILKFKLKRYSKASLPAYETLN